LYLLVLSFRKDRDFNDVVLEFPRYFN